MELNDKRAAPGRSRLIQLSRKSLLDEELLSLAKTKGFVANRLPRSDSWSLFEISRRSLVTQGPVPAKFTREEVVRFLCDKPDAPSAGSRRAARR
jgi:hypothetical protein